MTTLDQLQAMGCWPLAKLILKVTWCIGIAYFVVAIPLGILMALVGL